ncbi:MAG TPA: DUF1189 family protein [Dissulfurispiraceae bacterium]|nr:DUF1189 family protein [Dissulfurispiraceae bacterium]
MKKFGLTDPLYLSFYSKAVYRDVVRYWKGAGLFYLFSLVALCTISGMVKLDGQLTSFVGGEAPAYVKQLPTLTISKGRLSLPENRPYFINDPESGQTVAVIDTSGQIPTLDQTQARILVTSTQLIMKTSAEPLVLQLSQLEDAVLDHQKIFALLDFLSDWLAILFYPIALIMNFLYRLAQLLIFSLLAVSCARLMKLALGFKAIMRLTAIALTPMIVMNTLASFFGLGMPFEWALYISLAAGYILFGVRAVQEEQKTITA